MTNECITPATVVNPLPDIDFDVSEPENRPNPAENALCKQRETVAQTGRTTLRRRGNALR